MQLSLECATVCVKSEVILENKNVHHYFDAIENTVDISQLNDMSFGEETHSINETIGSMPQIYGKFKVIYPK